MTVDLERVRQVADEHRFAQLAADEELEDTTTARRFGHRLLDRAELEHLPQPEPIIDNTLDRRTVALLTGYWGTGKSFLALDWAACIATGKRWQGRAVNEDTVSVLYVAAEGASGLHQRLSAWEYAWQQRIQPENFQVYPRPLGLTSHDDMRHLRAWCRHEIPDLVILDTLARCMVGLEENSAKDMGAVVDSLYTIRDALDGGTVLGVHHTGKDRTTNRGSSALEAGVDTVYLVEGENGRMNLKRTKRKDGPTDDVMALKLHPVEHADSVVIVSSRGVDMRPSADALMSIYLSTFGGVGCSKVELRNVAGMNPSTFHRALSDLVRTGALVNTGTDQRPFYLAAETE